MFRCLFWSAISKTDSRADQIRHSIRHQTLRNDCRSVSPIDRSNANYLLFSGPPEEAGGVTTGKLTVNIAELSESGDFVVVPGASFETDRLTSLGREATGLVQEAFLEAAEGDACALEDSKACFRVLAVNEDDSAVMVGRAGLEWVKEEALAAVDKVGHEGILMSDVQ